MFKIFYPFLIENTSSFFVEFLGNDTLITETFTLNEVYAYFYKAIVFMVKMIGPFVIGVVLTCLLVNYLQVGFVFSFEPISPKIERINPIEGFKRIFSKRSILELVKSLLKIIIIGYLVFSTIKSKIDVFPLMLDMDIKTSFYLVINIAIEVGIKASFALFALAIVDYFFQWREYETGLMLSKQDVKEEYKEVEGDPQIKSKVRQVQRQLARSRMMQDVSKADVVITNPTHFAVALMYKSDIHPAPILIAKGKDLLAMRIKELANEADIPIVENKVLARTLYASVDIGDAIPENLYNAVAQILAFVYSLKGRRF